MLWSWFGCGFGQKTRAKKKSPLKELFHKRWGHELEIENQDKRKVTGVDKGGDRDAINKSTSMKTSWDKLKWQTWRVERCDRKTTSWSNQSVCVYFLCGEGDGEMKKEEWESNPEVLKIKSDDKERASEGQTPNKGREMMCKLLTGVSFSCQSVGKITKKIRQCELRLWTD